MSITRLARLHEIPLLERCGYRAVRQRGGLVEMVRPDKEDEEWRTPFLQEVLCTKRKEPAKPKLPDWDDLRGVAPDATGDLNSEEFVRKIRSEWPDKDAERLAFEVMANFMGSNV